MVASGSMLATATSELQRPRQGPRVGRSDSVSEASEQVPDVGEPLSDPERLGAVRATGLLGSPPMTATDELTSLAAELLHTPMAFLTLVDEKTSFWLSFTGVDTAGEQRGNPV